MDRKKKQKIKIFIIAGVIFIALAAILITTIYIKKYTPTKERMSGYDYFSIEKDESKALIILDNNRYTDVSVVIDGAYYISHSFVEDNLNVRFYYDKESDSIMYTDSSHIYSFKDNEQTYTDDTGKSYDAGMKVFLKKDGNNYLNWEYVARFTNCEYVYGNEPQRINITVSKDSIQCVTAKKDLKLRYRGGIKSPILEDVKAGSRLVFEKDYEDWIEVTTESGITGYVESSKLSEQFDYVFGDNYKEDYNKNLMQEKVNLGWFQVSGSGGNLYIDDYLSPLSNINVLSPTWYSIKDSSGNITSSASKDLVNKMHNKGIKVWVLVDDFDKNIDYNALYSSKTARTRMINYLIQEASSIGFDGINIDFENIKSDYSKHFLQFIRELSVACEKNNLVLSTDNYKPESYNRCYNLKEQASFVDYVIIMAYDEHYAGSDAGSVASLSFVKAAIDDTKKLVEANQIVIGIPFYTRVWTTKDGQTTSKAVGMQSAIDTLNAAHQTALWNEECGQYVVSYETSQGTIKIWFEEEKSVEEKMKAIKDAQVAGVAEWRLGLEKPAVWNVISQYLG